MMKFNKYSYTLDAKIVEEIRKDPANILNYDIESEDGIELLAAAVKLDMRVLEYIPEYLKKDEYVMFRVVCVAPKAISRCDCFKFDRAFMYRAVEANQIVYIYSPEWVRADRGISITAFKNKHSVFDCISPELIEDMNFILGCIKADYRLYAYLFYKRGFTEREKMFLIKNEARLAGYMTDYMSDRVKVLEIAAENPFIVKYMDRELLSDREFVRKLLEANGLVLKYLPAEMRADRELVLAAAGSNAIAFTAAAEELKADREFVKEAVKTNWFVLKLTDMYKDDKEIVTEAVKQNFRAARYMGRVIRMNEDFLRSILELEPETAAFIRLPEKEEMGRDDIYPYSA